MISQRQLLNFVDDDTYIFITTPEGGRVEVQEMKYHTERNQLEIKCGGTIIHTDKKGKVRSGRRGRATTQEVEAPESTR